MKLLATTETLITQHSALPANVDIMTKEMLIAQLLMPTPPSNLRSTTNPRETPLDLNVTPLKDQYVILLKIVTLLKNPMLSL
jgi:hypothetical protein